MKIEKIKTNKDAYQWFMDNKKTYESSSFAAFRIGLAIGKNIQIQSILERQLKNSIKQPKTTEK